MVNELGALILDEAADRMGKAVAHLTDELKGIRTGRASPALLDAVRVDYYGSPTSLVQLAQISVPEPRLIMIKPFDPSTLGEIEKAIHKSNLGIPPNNDGKVIRLVLPPLSEEQRRKLAATVKDMAEQTRVSLRNIRRELNKQVDEAEKDSEFTEDQAGEMRERIQQVLKDYEGQVDEVLKRKTQEIMEV